MARDDKPLMQKLWAPPLTRLRIILALAVAVAADGLQVLLAPVPLADQIIDFCAMILTMWLLGFHLLLLPTFIVELVPVIDALPTWTACTAAVIALRKRDQNSGAPPPLPDPKQIDGPPKN